MAAQHNAALAGSEPDIARDSAQDIAPGAAMADGVPVGGPVGGPDGVPVGGPDGVPDGVPNGLTGDELPANAEPLGLSLGLHRLLDFNILQLANRISTDFARLYATFGIGIPEWRVLAVLGEQGPVTANQICQVTYMDRAIVSRAVSGLVDKNYVVRRGDASDRRRIILHLTRGGAVLCSRIVPAARARQERLLSVLTPDEIDRLFDSLFTIREKVDRMLDEDITVQPAG